MHHNFFMWCRKVLVPCPVSLAIAFVEDVVLWISLVDRKKEDMGELYL